MSIVRQLLAAASDNQSFSRVMNFESQSPNSDARTLCLPHLLYKPRIKFNFVPTVSAASDDGHEQISADTSNNAQEAVTTVDQLQLARPNVVITEDEVNMFIERETGQDRLRAMFSKDHNGEISNDLATVKQVAQTCGIFFFIVTSIAGGREARARFLEKNKATVYATKFRAFRAYNDAIFFGSMRFGIKWGLKSLLFAGLFMLTAQTVSVYRNRTSVTDYMLGGGLTCALLRMNMGLRGLFAGGVIGCGMGLISGVGMYSLLHFSNETQQQRHFLYVHEALREKREAEMMSQRCIATD